MKTNQLKLGMLALIGAMTCSNSMAASPATATMTVKTVMAPSCLLKVQDVHLGIITPNISGGFAVSNAVIKIICTRGTSYSVIRQSNNSLNNQNAQGSNNSGRMSAQNANPPELADKLDYFVYNEIDAAWPVDEIGINDQGVGNEKDHPITIKVPLNQYIRADQYSDNMTLFINY